MNPVNYRQVLLTRCRYLTRLNVARFACPIVIVVTKEEFGRKKKQNSGLKFRSHAEKSHISFEIQYQNIAEKLLKLKEKRTTRSNWFRQNTITTEILY